MVAYDHSQPDVVKFLVEKGADVNAKNIRGNTALMWASRMGNLEVAKLLLEKGADINAKNLSDETALRKAHASHQLEMVNFLKSHGAKE